MRKRTRILHESHRNPLEHMRSRIMEMPNGDYYYVEYNDGKLQAGSATNTGFIPVYEIAYDWDEDVDYNLACLYDVVTRIGGYYESMSRNAKYTGRSKPMRNESVRISAKGYNKKKKMKEMRLNERQWKYKLKVGSKLRDAIDDEDYEKVLMYLEASYDELLEAGIIDEDFHDDLIEELKFIDLDYDDEEDIEYALNDALDGLYDVCDDLDVWVSLQTESYRNPRKMESFSRRRKPIYRESLGSDIGEYQKWVDYDMKRYGRISKTTMGDIRKAGLSVVKDQYGDYEVIAHRADESIHISAKNRGNKRVKESIHISARKPAQKRGRRNEVEERYFRPTSSRRYR